MADNIQRKRKRAESDSTKPRKSQKVDARATAPEPSLGEAQDAKEKGQRRQEKSERRSKSSKKHLPLSTRPKDITTKDLPEEEEAAAAEPITTTDHILPEDATKKAKPSQGQSSDTRPSKSSQAQVRAKAPSSEQPQDKDKSSRFILFVGNLPYTATTAQITAHFSKLAPTAVRHNTNKDTGKSKGFAFLEFDRFDRMETCLKLYHHSIFNPAGREDVEGTEKKSDRVSKGRKINVELTAGGGGGKSQARKQKIKGKNAKLEAERERKRAGEKKKEAKEKVEREKRAGTDANKIVVAENRLENRGDIHPSRMSRVSG